MSEQEPEEQPFRPFLAEGVGMLISLLDEGTLEDRRYKVVNRLRRLRDSNEFALLPEDLRERVREITSDSAPTP